MMDDAALPRRLVDPTNAIFPAALRRRAYAALNGMLAWRPQDAPQAVRVLEAAGAAVVQGRLWADDNQGRGPEVVPVVHGKVRAHFWECPRDAGESWPTYVARAATTAHANLPKATKVGESIGPALAPYIRLDWTTEEEAALFDLPPIVRRLIDAGTPIGEPPWAYISFAGVNLGIRVRIAGTTAPGSFFSAKQAAALADVPRSARFLYLDGNVPDLEELPGFKHLETLVLGPVGERELAIVGQAKSLRIVSLTGIRTTTLDRLAGLTRLEHLACADSPSLTKLGALRALPKLRTLVLGHLRKFTDLREVSPLTQLRGLTFGGSMWTAARVKTLTPLSALTGLQVLEVSRVRVADASLRPLTALRRLRYLGVSNWFPIDQFAEVAAVLPDVGGGGFRSIWWFPPEPTDQYDFRACKRCKRFTLGMTTGKPAKRLCPECDRAKIAKHTERWEALVAAARARRSRAPRPTV
jgi:RNA polymerase subunit RPABC4/transcription elongation factor Spt4